jgi:hypothetical protein
MTTPDNPMEIAFTLAAEAAAIDQNRIVIVNGSVKAWNSKGGSNRRL